MKRTLIITAATAGLLLAAGLAALLALSAYSSGDFADPESARCGTPQPTFGAVHRRADHRELDVHFTCAGAVIAGTLDLPGSPGSHPAVVWVHGAGAAQRLRYDAPLVQSLVHAGIAVFSYDKRGVAESQGTCCPGDEGQFNLLAADVDGAVNALRGRSEIDRDRIGLLGASQAGWIVPLAVARGNGRVSFTALVDAPTVSAGDEYLYSLKTGEEGVLGRLAWGARTGGGLWTPGPAGFDPRPFLERQTIPGLWLYGGADRSQPTAQSVDVLDGLKGDGKDFTVVVYDHAAHGLLDVPPSDPRALPTVVAWIAERTDAAT